MEHHSFTRRLNNDATIDSICPRCFATVGHSLQEADLERAEQNHICNPRLVEHYRTLRDAVEKYRNGRRGSRDQLDHGQLI
jgi:hypothetical protein